MSKQNMEMKFEKKLSTQIMKQHDMFKVRELMQIVMGYLQWADEFQFYRLWGCAEPERPILSGAALKRRKNVSVWYIPLKSKATKSLMGAIVRATRTRKTVYIQCGCCRDYYWIEVDKGDNMILPHTYKYTQDEEKYMFRSFCNMKICGKKKLGCLDPNTEISTLGHELHLAIKNTLAKKGEVEATKYVD